MTADMRGTTTIPSVDDAEAYVAMICFKHGPPERVGVELEWTTHHRDGHDRPLDPERLAHALGEHAPATVAPSSRHLPLTSGSLITVEPGGQVEISSRPSASVAALLESMAADIAALDALLEPAGLVRGGAAIDAHRRPERVLDVPRYAAMQAFFDRLGPWGSSMMCSTASSQVCVDAGDTDSARLRWRALHSAGPVVAALFANSPVVAGYATGWASNRLRATLSTCPPVTHPLAADEDPVEGWVRTAMAAPVVCVRRPGRCWDTPRPMTFADWVAGTGDTRPTYDDLDYHLSTLFPPVRPRGYVEVRYIDAQPADRWQHPTILLCALLSSPQSVQRCIELTEHCSSLWLVAARNGLRDLTLRRAARHLVELAADGVDALGLASPVIEPFLDTLDRRTSHLTARRLPA